MNVGLLKRAIPIATILAVLVSPLTPAAEVYAWPQQTWNTQAAFSAGLLINVDNITSPNNILLATNLDNGDGKDGSLTVGEADDEEGPIYFVDEIRTGVSMTSYIGSSYISVNSNTGFEDGQEVLIIQMTGTGAGTWETDNISPHGVEPTLLNFTRQLKNAYYTDANSKAQVIKVPHFKDVTVNYGGEITCHPWIMDSQTGGVIFFRATGTVTINTGGVIDASGCGFQGGSGGTQGGGSGGQGGAKGDKNTGNGYDGAVNGGGGKGGNPGFCIMHGWGGGDGGYQGYGGASGQQGTAGGGPGGGASDHGGTNDSTASLSLMQAGSGGGGGSSGRQGYGGGGGGGGGLNACVLTIGGQNGKSGNSGGSPGAGGSGGLGAGIIAVHANKIVANQGSLIQAQGQTTPAADNGGTGGNGGAGGCGENFCGQSVNGNWQSFGAGGGGGGGNGGGGGGGGNGCGGGSGGTVWLAANNINLATNVASALGATGGVGGQGGSGGSGGAGGCGGSGDEGCNGQNGSNGASGATGPAGPTGGKGGAGAVRLDYISLSGSTTPVPGYTSGLYYASGSIASNVWHDTDTPSENWSYLSWQETVPSGTGITFEARASDTEFDMGAATTPAWRSVGGISPVTSELPSGRYMQWRATLTTANSFYTPVLHSVTAASSLAPIVTTSAATFVNSNGAVMNGTLSSLGQSPTNVNVEFFWGTSPGGPYTRTGWQRMTAPGTFVSGLTGLSPGTPYYYKAWAYDGVNPAVLGDEVSFTTSPVSPSVTTNSAGSITSGSAILNGYLSSKGGATTDNVSFQWGTTQGGPYPNSTTPEVMDSTGSFQAGISGLGPNATYYYRAKADGGTDRIDCGAEMNFTTSRAPPSVTTGDATSVTSSSATLNGSLASMGAATTVSVSFRYGTAQGGPYPNSTSLQAKTTSGPFTAGLTGLTANTVYYFMASGDGGVNGTGYGSEMSFTTSKVPPSVATAGAHNITAGSATLNGQIVSLGTATTVNTSFLWGTQQDNLNTETPYQVLTVPVGFQANLTGLTANTTYYFRAKADGGVHGTGYGVIMSFRTAKVPPSVTTNGATPTPPSSATLKGTLHSLGSAPMVEVSFQYGITSGIYDNQTTVHTMITFGDFHDDLVGLTAGITYYYRAKADGGIHGIAYGTEHMFTTGRTPPMVTTDNATYVTTNSAALNGNLTAWGIPVTTVNVSFQYGTTQGGPYPNLTPLQPMTALEAFQAGLTSLSSHTMYYYRAKADGGINGGSYGDEMSFRTSMFPPYVETLPATGTGSADTATLNGNLYNLGSATTDNVSFLYGVMHGGPYPISTPPHARNSAGAFNEGLTGLTSGRTYYYRARGDGGAYGVGDGAEMSFTTGKIPPSVTTDPADNITANLATLNGHLTDPRTADNVSFQYGDTHGGPYPSSTTPQAKTAADPPFFQFNLTGLPGDTTYYYRAKADGGVYGTGYGAEDNFTTSMVPPAVTTDNATAVAATSATLNGFLDSVGTAGTDNVSFGWGTSSGSYPNSTPAQVMANAGPFHADLNGLLAPLTEYFFIARAYDGAHDSVEGSECTFTTGATPPSVSTRGATFVTSNSATLNGDLHSLGAATSDNVSFQWGANPGVYSNQTTPQVTTTLGDFNDSIASLVDNTTYYYRAVASGGGNGTSFGAEQAFTTSADPPEVTTNMATHMTTDTAWLNGNLTDRGTATTDSVSFVYGTTPKGPYLNSTSPRPTTETGPFHDGVTGLTPFTTYYFKARADGGIYGTGYGAEDNFTTNHLPPVIWTGGANDIMANAATLNGNLYLMGSAPTVNVSFEYSITKDGPYTETAPPQAMTEREAFQADLTGLESATTYYYRAKGTGDNGTGLGAEQVFTTGALPPSVTTDSATGIAATSATLNGDLNLLGSAKTVNVSYEWGATQGGPYTNTTALQAKTATGAFNAGLSGLTSFTVYYYRARADGGMYSNSHGEEMSFITTLTPPSVTTGDAASITSNSAILNGELTTLGRAGTVDVSFQWGTTRGGPHPNTTPTHTLSGPASFWSNLSGLSPGTPYYFIAEGDGGVYGVSYGVEKSFIALPPPPPPTPHPPPPHSSGQTSSVTPSMPVPLPNVVVQSASLSATRVAPGAPVEVTASIVNRGTVNGSTVIRLYVNGQEETSRGVTVESGKTKSIVFTTFRNQPGTYTVYAGGVQAGSFMVSEYIAPNGILLISIFLILASLVLGLIYAWRRRRQEY